MDILEKIDSALNEEGNINPLYKDEKQELKRFMNSNGFNYTSIFSERKKKFYKIKYWNVGGLSKNARRGNILKNAAVKIFGQENIIGIEWIGGSYNPSLVLKLEFS